MDFTMAGIGFTSGNTGETGDVGEPASSTVTGTCTETGTGETGHGHGGRETGSTESGTDTAT